MEFLDKIGKMLQKRKKIFIVVIIFSIFAFGIILISKGFAALTPVKSVEIFSENLNYNEKEHGSWKITKNAEWIEKGIAEITFDVDTISKKDYKYTDVLFVLDLSSSMYGDKLNRVKRDVVGLLNALLDEKQNRAGLITFDTDSRILSEFTNDKDYLINTINRLSLGGTTNYYQALVDVDAILKNYVQEKERNCIVLFLTDGFPNEDVPNEQIEYQYLKSAYPYITINAVQYEMGFDILEQVKKVSDYQYHADMETLNNVLVDATDTSLLYETFEIMDYIDTNYFYVNSEDDINVSTGKVNFDKTNQSIYWNITSLKSGGKATMTINATLKDEFIGMGGVYPTNKKEVIKSKILDEIEEQISEKTPVLADNYKVVYDGNSPSKCIVTGVPESENKSVLDMVEISDIKPKCAGYEFKGWKLVTTEVNKVNDELFIMPEKNVTFRADWGKISLEKSVNGTISEIYTFYSMMKGFAVPDDERSTYVDSYNGIDFGDISSDTNGNGVYLRATTKNDKYPILYYRGDVKDNNVKFANFCWKIVRTTETGGVKLVYNGEPDVNGDCTKITGNQTQIETSQFNPNAGSPADLGYMYGTRYELKQAGKPNPSRDIIYGNDVEWNGSEYVLKDTITSNSDDWSKDYRNIAKKYHYTCYTTESSCKEVRYINYFVNNIMLMTYLTLKDGKDIEDVKKEMFSNTNDSTIKQVIDRWYQTSMLNYTDKLEDTIWCNDRSIYVGALKGKDEDASSYYLGSYSTNTYTHFGATESFLKNHIPNLQCLNKNDQFTVSVNNGNGKLKYPTALLTSDEVMLAGGANKDNTNYYLYTNENVWVMSPRHAQTQYATSLFRVTTTGSVGGSVTTSAVGVRPVISLAPGTIISSGDGTATHPYIVLMD